ncbi:MAG TPA: endonuclease/exonuclease/phosphatase family protein [Candidatus Limnocylindrales bacterium]|nr:endonuclease/exonuclease/phosphatase family protein [Candidatus Limnocylindrales bacterium]
MKDYKGPALIALLFTVTVELLRAGGPLLDSLAGALGIEAAAIVAIGLFTLPGTLVVTLRRATLPGMILLLMLVRLVAQIAPNLPIVLAGGVLGLVCLALAVQRATDPVEAMTGVLAGGAIDLGIRSATMTWDPLWTGLWGLPVVLLLAVAFWFSLFTDDRERPRRGRAWSVGAYLALWTTTIGNPAFLSSSSLVPVQVALIVMIAGVLVSLEVARRIALSRFLGVPALVGLVVGVVAAWWGSGWIVAVGIFLAQLCAAVSLARAVSGSGHRGNALLGLIWVLPVLLYQVHYEQPLPFDNRYILVVVAVLLGLGGLVRPRAESEAEALITRTLERPTPAKLELPPGMLQVRRPLPQLFLPATLGLALLLLVPLGFLTITPADAKPLDAPGLRLMTWNVMYGRDEASGGVNPAQIAEVIRGQNVDIVVLQEVSRGWAIGGGTDLAEYLRRELGMAAYWAPAADGQFGNLLLAPKSRRLEVEHHYLPYGQGPMWRSYLKARVGGLTVIATHLTHRKENTPTRLEQIQTILGEKPDVVVGDLNFWPTWDERNLFVSAGMFSAQDETGNGAGFTSPTSRPTNRVDWVWTGRRVEVGGFRILSEVKASDHFPIVALLNAPGVSL